MLMTIKNSIVIDVNTQTLKLQDSDGQVLMEALISTGRKGLGEINGSEQTPRGSHIIRAKIGDHQPVNTVFVGRRPTNEIYTSELREQHPERDWILTRILWLSGTESGKNRSGDVDTMRRYIYIHGAPDEDEMGVPGSHGCIKMRNRDVVELFDKVALYTPVMVKG
jgi:lipoprotein-anchoring transpeptidase ErfK/SrfK